MFFFVFLSLLALPHRSSFFLFLRFFFFCVFGLCFVFFFFGYVVCFGGLYPGAPPSESVFQGGEGGGGGGELFKHSNIISVCAVTSKACPSG